MSYCPKCGYEIKDEDDEFCSRCGTKIKKPITVETPVSSSPAKKDWCLKCGKELPYGHGEWPPGFPKICPNCGAKVQDAAKSSSTDGQTGTLKRELKKSTFPQFPLLIIVFIFSLFWIYASSLSDASYILYALLGMLALYWIYKGGDQERKYVKYIGYFSILFGIIVIINALSISTTLDVYKAYGELLLRSYMISYSGDWDVVRTTIKGTLILEGIMIILFGVLLWVHVKSKEREITGG